MAKPDDFSMAAENWIAEMDSLATPICWSDGALYAYTDGYWTAGVDKDEAAIKRLHRHAGARGITYVKEERALWREVAARLMKEEVEERAVMDKEPALVCTNGTLLLGSRELVKHSPERYFRRHVDLVYDPEIECPEWLLALDRALEDYGPEDREDIKSILQEFFGVSVVGKRGLPRALQKGLFLYGASGTGKSSVSGVLRALFPEGKITTLSVDRAMAQYGRQELITALAWIADEAVSDKAIPNVGDLKRLLDGDRMTAEVKYRDAMPFQFQGPVMFTANNLPKITEHSEALFNRLLAFRFNRVFTAEDAVGHFGNAANLAEHLHRKKEMSGVLNWALAGYDRAVSVGKFTSSSAVTSLHETFLRSIPVGDFLLTMTQEDKRVVNRLDTLASLASQFADVQHGIRLSPASAAKAIDSLLPSTRQTARMSRLGAKREVVGLALNKDGLLFLEKVKEFVSKLGETPKVNYQAVG